MTLGWPLRDPWETLGSPNPNPSRQRVATPETQNATESPLRNLKNAARRTIRRASNCHRERSALAGSRTIQIRRKPLKIYQLLSACQSAYITASILLRHARTSSSAADMSFATLCLTWVHVFGTGLGQLTQDSLQKIRSAEPHH